MQPHANLKISHSGLVSIYMDGWQTVSEARAATLVRQAAALAETGRNAARAANGRAGLLLLALRAHLRRTIDPRAGEASTWNAKLESMGVHKQTAWRWIEAAVRHGDQAATRVCDASVLVELCHGCWPEFFSGKVRAWGADRTRWLEQRSGQRSAARKGDVEAQGVAAVRAIAEMFSKHPLWAPVIQRELEEGGLAPREAAELAEAMATVGRYAARMGKGNPAGAHVRGARSA